MHESGTSRGPARFAAIHLGANNMHTSVNYWHRQRAPFCWLLYILGAFIVAFGLSVPQEPVVQWILLFAGGVMLLLAAAFHHLTVNDEVDRLSIAFGPLPLFRRTVLYEDIVSVSVARTTLLDGWGIHLSLRGGWVWNIWGRDCVVLQLRKSKLTVGTDEPQQLSEFLRTRIPPSTTSDEG